MSYLGNLLLPKEIKILFYIIFLMIYGFVSHLQAFHPLGIDFHVYCGVEHNFYFVISICIVVYESG